MRESDSLPVYPAAVRLGDDSNFAGKFSYVERSHRFREPLINGYHLVQWFSVQGHASLAVVEADPGNGGLTSAGAVVIMIVVFSRQVALLTRLVRCCRSVECPSENDHDALRSYFARGQELASPVRHTSRGGAAD